MKNKLVFFILINLAIHTIAAQNVRQDLSLKIRKATSKIVLDGKLDEESWKQADVAGDFTQNFPTDSLKATFQTEVRLTFDDEYFYVGIICHDKDDNYIVASLKRDFGFFSSESVNLYVDPYNDLTNGFAFGISPLGIQREGLFSEREEISMDWDNKWYSKVTNLPDKWVGEIAIPFKTLRYNENNNIWNINFLRRDLKNNEMSTWARVPQQFRPNNILYSGKVIWENPPPKPGANVSVIPYVSGGISKNIEANTSTDYNFDAGFDAKIGVTPSLNLDLTFNPDFSQVEVDDQVTNLDRFEIFFPEKRQFFLENSDLFANSGFPDSRPFFSRRIGIERDTNRNNVQVPILYGARLSGKIDQNWRVGILNMQTQKDKGLNILGQNYTMATIQRKLFGSSNLQVLFVNRQATDFDERDESYERSKYNRVWGIEYNFASNNNRWQGEVYYHKSDDPGENDKSFSHGGFIGYNSRNLNVRWFHSIVGENYNAEVGFVPRKGFTSGNLEINPVLYPKSEAINKIEPEFSVGYTTDADFKVLDKDFSAEVNFNFSNTSEFGMGIEGNFVTLTRAFDPTNSGGEELVEGSEHNWTRFGAKYESDGRKIFNYEAFVSYGGFFNGTLFEAGGSLGYRYQPFANFSLNFTYNDIKLPDPYKDASFWLIGPKIDFTFTDKLFFTTFIQYNEQRDNLNINARFQWRFKPVSDLFIVYTDNYFPENFKTKNRALVVKLSYWLNL